MILKLNRVGKDHCVEIINHCEPTTEGKKNKCMGIDGMVLSLLHYMLLHGLM